MKAPSSMCMQGKKESRNHISNVKRLKSSLFRTNADQSQLRFHLTINPDGTHSEQYWKAAFPDAVRWLYFNE